MHACPAPAPACVALRATTSVGACPAAASGSRPAASRLGWLARPLLPAPSARRAAALPRGLCVQASTAAALPAPLQKIVTSFQMVPDPMQRYKQLLFYASKLKPMPAELHSAENKVPGCVSQVWVYPSLGPDGRVAFQADSDSQLTKGLAALLVEGLSGCTPQEVLSVTPEFVQDLGLKQSLTPSRTNGFLNMLRLMQKKTIELAVAAGGAAAGGEGSSGAAAAATAAPAPAAAAAAAPSAGPAAAAAAAAAAAPAAPYVPGDVRKRMEAALAAALAPASMLVSDNSDQHAGHAGARVLGRSGETHFSVDVVSSAFEGLPLIKRHRMVYAALDAEIKGGVHALQLSTRTPAEAGMA